MRKCVFLLITVLSVLRGAYGQPSGEPPSQGFSPQTILISEFTFAVPEDWEWLDTRSDIKNVLEAIRFQINGDENCQAFLAHFQPHNEAGEPDAVARRWKEWFQNTQGEVAFGERTRVGTHYISYVKITGTFKGEPPRRGLNIPDYVLCGAVIERDEGNLVLRANGTASTMRKTEADFRKMIERALQPE